VEAKHGAIRRIDKFKASSHPECEVAGDGEPESGATRSFGSRAENPCKGGEDLLAVGGGDAGSAIVDF
jgi:hypothetical protein